MIRFVLLVFISLAISCNKGLAPIHSPFNGDYAENPSSESGKRRFVNAELANALEHPETTEKLNLSYAGILKLPPEIGELYQLRELILFKKQAL